MPPERAEQRREPQRKQSPSARLGDLIGQRERDPCIRSKGKAEGLLPRLSQNRAFRAVRGKLTSGLVRFRRLYFRLPVSPASHEDQTAHSSYQQRPCGGFRNRTVVVSEGERGVSEGVQRIGSENSSRDLDRRGIVNVEDSISGRANVVSPATGSKAVGEGEEVEIIPGTVE
jgi:hypothetical protein